MTGPARDPGRHPPEIRLTSGPLRPPWYQRRWVVVLAGLLLVGVLDLLYQPFLDAAEDRSRSPFAYRGNGRSLFGFVPVLVVLLRPSVLRLVRSRVRVLADAGDEGGWRAGVATAVVNAGYVLVVVGPGRWALTSALTAYATGAARFTAADEVVAEAAARYGDRATGVVLLAMALHGCLAHLAGRGRRRLGLRA